MHLWPAFKLRLLNPSLAEADLGVSGMGSMCLDTFHNSLHILVCVKNVVQAYGFPCVAQQTLDEVAVEKPFQLVCMI